MAKTRDSMKEMATKFVKLDKFEGQDFRRWQKKMHFMLTSFKVAYVLATPCPEEPPPVPEVVDGETEAHIAAREAIVLLHRKYGKW